MTDFPFPPPPPPRARLDWVSWSVIILAALALLVFGFYLLVA